MRQLPPMTISQSVAVEQLEEIVRKAVEEGSTYWIQDYAPRILLAADPSIEIPTSRCLYLSQPPKDLPPGHRELIAPVNSIIPPRLVQESIAKCFTDPAVAGEAGTLVDIRGELAHVWPDFGDIDAGAADFLLQVAVFERVTYEYQD